MVDSTYLIVGGYFDIGDGHAVVNAAAVAQVGGEGLDCALASAEHYALIEDGESRDEVAAREGLARYLVEVGHVHGVVALVEGDGLDVHLRVKQLGALGPYAERIVYVGLRANGGIDPEVFDAVFVPARIKYFLGMDADGFPDAGRAVHRAGQNPVCHVVSSYLIN